MSTNPTADAAKLLPCPTCKSEKPEWRRAYVADGKVQTCRDPYHDTRPQPAPPAGELKLPDWPKRDGFCPVCNGNDYDVPCAYPTECPTGCWRAERLGLAARPKVEDAEVTKIANDLRESGKVLDNGVTKILDAGFFVKAADLLERLVESRDNGRIAVTMAVDSAEAAEAKLAEREAELAKADALIAGVFEDDGMPTDCRDIRAAAVKRHAARQQQNASAEPTASKAGETR